ncbi:hypothetical protein TIFTF001_030819 [Ficus carica]|uniref:Uncharacterized protein n=1 Tax=Ficus carica TaxID=3494 RepID=A0AA88J083_FICCA|nr:hypothetical protein TIFTF001_030819 [Ficus carica]
MATITSHPLSANMAPPRSRACTELATSNLRESRVLVTMAASFSISLSPSLCSRSRDPKPSTSRCEAPHHQPLYLARPKPPSREPVSANHPSREPAYTSLPGANQSPSPFPGAIYSREEMAEAGLCGVGLTEVGWRCEGAGGGWFARGRAGGDWFAQVKADGDPAIRGLWATETELIGVVVDDEFTVGGIEIEEQLGLGNHNDAAMGRTLQIRARVQGSDTAVPDLRRRGNGWG